MVRDTDARAALPRPGPDAPGRARRREQALAQEPLRGRRRLLPAGPGLSVPAARRPVLRLRHVGQEQAALGLLRRRAALRATTPTRRSSARRFDLGADVFGVAFPFAETNYRDGVEIKSESDQAPAGVLPGQHRPSRSARTSRPRSGSSRSGTTTSATRTRAPDFVTPVDTFTYGAGAAAELEPGRLQPRGARRLLRARTTGQPWGDPATSGYDPEPEGLLEVLGRRRARASTSPNFRKLLVGLATSAATTSTASRSGTSARSRRTSLRGFPSGSRARRQRRAWSTSPTA